MVVALPLLNWRPGTLIKSHTALEDHEEASRLDDISQQLKGLLLRLLLARTRRQLYKLIPQIQREYLHLRFELMRTLATEATDTSAQLLQEIHDEVSALIQADTIVLSPQNREMLLTLIEGSHTLTRALNAMLDSNQTHALEVFLECNDSLQAADMCISAVLVVLVGEARDWNPGAIRALCAAADEYMVDVEDIILAHDESLVKDSGERTETISLNEAKKRFGL